MSSTLTKHVRVLMVGVALVAMTLIIFPGVAEAKQGGGRGDGGLGGSDNHSAKDSGKGACGADSGSQATKKASGSGDNNAHSLQGSGGNGGSDGGDRNNNESKGNVGQATGQDLLDVGNVNAANNNNFGVNAPVASPRSDQTTSNDGGQSVDNSSEGPGSEGPGSEGPGSDSFGGDSPGELAFAAPARTNSDSGSYSGSDDTTNNSSSNDGTDPTSAANPSDPGSRTLAGDSSGSRPQTLSANPFSARTLVALSAGPSGSQDRALASSVSKTKRTTNSPTPAGIELSNAG